MTNQSPIPISQRQAIAGLSASLLISGGVLIADSFGKQSYQINDSSGSICGASRCQINAPKPHRFIEAAIGTLLLGCGVGASRFCTLGDDLLILIKIGSAASWGWVNDALEELAPSEGLQQRVINLALTATPIKIKTWVEATAATQNDWFTRISNGHVRLGGETGVGKTTIAEALIADRLLKHPDSQIAICDINYGKRNKDWLGISPDFIYPKIEQIAAIIQHEYEELTSRRDAAINAKKAGKQLPNFTPRLLVLDELDSTAEDLGGKESELMKQLRALAKQGLGYGWQLILIGQSFAVGETGISLATSKQFSNILLIKGKLPKSELGYLNPSNADEIESQVTQLQKAGLRIAIAQLGESTPEVVVIPDLSHLSQIKLSHRDPLTDWWANAWTPELEVWAKEQAALYAKGEIPSPLKPLAAKLGIQTLNSDARYTQYLKPTWEQILTNAKNGGIEP